MTIVSGEAVRGRHRPYVTVALIVINVVVYLYTSGGLLVSTLPRYVSEYGYKPIYMLTSAETALVALFTSMFTHADIFHIFFNMLFLWIFGSRVEKLVGHARFLALYLLSGATAVVFHTAFSPFGGIEALGIPAVGASGAISGVLGTYLLLLPHTKITMCTFFLFIPFCFSLPAYAYLLLWFAQQVLYGYLVLGGVAYFAHIGGFVAGLLLAPIVARSLMTRRTYVDELLARYLESVLGIVLPRRRGLSTGAKVLLSLLLVAVAAGFIYIHSVLLPQVHENALAYVAYVKAESNGLVEDENVALYVINGEVSTSQIVIDSIRVLVNRLQPVLYSPEHAGQVVKKINDSYVVTIYGVRVPVYLNATIAYDDAGVVSHSSGVLVSRAVVPISVGGAVKYVAEEQERVMNFEVLSKRADWQILESMCLISAALSLLAIASVLVSKSAVAYYELPLPPIV